MITKEIEDKIAECFRMQLEVAPGEMDTKENTYRLGFLQCAMDFENSIHWYSELVKTKRELEALKEEYSAAKKRYEYYDTRFVEVCKNCSDSEKEDCVLRMINPDHCKNCSELVDMDNLLDQACNNM